MNQQATKRNFFSGIVNKRIGNRTEGRNALRIVAMVTFAVLALVALCLDAIADAPVFTWNGGGTDGNWATGGNWGGTAPGSPQNNLNFAGNTRLNNTNNFSTAGAGYRIFFNSGAGSFNLNGNGIRFFDFGGLDPKIENNSATAQTVNFPITNANTTLSGTVCPIELNPISGHLTNLNLVRLLASTNQLQVWGNNGNTLSFGAASFISGPGSVALKQNSTVLYQSAHTYTGDTFINAGTLLINSGGSANSSIIRLGDITSTNTASLAFGTNANLNSAVVARSGSTGTKFISSGITSGSATNSGNVLLDNDLVLTNATGGTLVFNGSTFDLKNQTLFITNAGTVTLNSVLQNSTGAGKLNKNGGGTFGGGTLNLSATNTFTGGTTLNAGVIQANTGAAFGAGNVTVSTTDFATGKILVNGVTVTNNLTITAANSGSTQGVIQAVDATSPTWSGAITINSNAASGGHFFGPITSGLLTISGPVTVGGSATTLLVREGFVRFSGGGSYTNIQIRNRTNSIGALNGISTAAVMDIAGNGSTTVPTAFDLNGFDQTLAGLKNVLNPANLARVTNSSATAATLTLDLGANVVSYSGSIMGNLAFSVISGTQTLATNTRPGNASFTYMGDTTISGGTLKAGFPNVLPNGAGKGNVVVSGAGTLDLNTFSVTVNGLSGNGTVDTVAGGTPTLTVGYNDQTSTFSGTIKNSLGTLTVTKAGNGTLTLDGANTYSGVTTVSAGTLLINGVTDTGPVLVTSGTLGGSGLIKGPVTIQSGGQLAPGTSLGILTISNSLSLSGAALMELDAAIGTNDLVRGITSVTYGGTLVVSNLAGTITAANAFKLFSANSYSGIFASLVPASPGLGLAWNTNTLATDGTLRIVSTTPVTITNTRSGSLFTLSWPADHIGWRLQAQTNSLGTNWLDVLDSTATNQIILTLDLSVGSVFYRLLYP